MKAEGGFTVVEVLVALSILGLGMVVLLQSTVTAVRFHERSRRMTEALSLAQSHMEAIRSRGWEEAVATCTAAIPAELEAEGLQRTLVRRGRRYCLVSERGVPGPALELYRVSCFWEGADRRFNEAHRVRLTSAVREPW